MSRCKYYKQIEQVSYDRGETWEDVYPEQTRKGELYEEDSDDCEPYQRWTLVPGGYICEDGSKYEKKVLEVSDDGVTYRIKYPDEYMKGDLIEEDSVECNFKWYGRYVVVESGGGGGHIPYDPGTLRDPIKIVLCYGSTSELTFANVDYGNTNYKAFSGYIGNCVTSIDSGTFSGCSYLTDIDNFPNGVTSIGNSTFYGCSSLSSFTIPDSVTSIGGSAFAYCSGLTSIDIPDSVTSIGASAFYYCTSLSSCTIGSGVTSIGASAFTNCTSLTSITIPNGVTSIGQNAFDECSGLTSCTIGSGVTIIYQWAFSNCSNLNNITVLATNPPTLDHVSWMGPGQFNNTGNCPIYVPSDSVASYKSYWSDYASRIQPIPTS